MLVVPDSMPVPRALEALRQARVSMALVVDEYGEVEGVVTVEDVLEAVVGDMPERRLGEEPAIVRRDDGSLLMDGMLAIDEVKLALGLDSLPEEESYHTLAGFVLAQLGRVPDEGAGGRLWRLALRGRRHGRAAHRQGAGAPRDGPRGGAAAGKGMRPRGARMVSRPAAAARPGAPSSWRRTGSASSLKSYCGLCSGASAPPPPPMKM